MEGMGPEGPGEELPSPANHEAEPIMSAPAERPQNLSYGEREVSAEGLKKQSEVAFKLSSDAAEKDKPLEKQLEERHEKKGSLDARQQVHSVASVLENMKTRQPNLVILNQAVPKSSAKAKEVGKSKNSSSAAAASQTKSLYKQAVVGGFIAAVVTIVFFMLLLLLA